MSKKIFLAALLALAAAGFIVVYLLIVILTTTSLSSLKKPVKPVSKPVAEQPAPPKTADCWPNQKIAMAVGGLNRNDVPRLPDALRTNYDNHGQSQYSTRQKERTIFEYYLSQLASQCWELTALKPSEALWNKGNQFLKIAVTENPLGGKTLVSYTTLSPRVLGTFYLAQSCAEGEVYCPNSGCHPAGSTCPPSTPPSSCSSSFALNGTYSCNYSACPNGCTFNGPSGCPDGCYTPPASTTCTSQYSLNGTYSCNYSTCPNGCTFNGPGGCPDGCYTPPAATTCTGEYQQPGVTYPSCNYTKCPNGCSWSSGANSCPTGCYTPTTCSGEYQQPNTTYPSCNYTKCPNGCTWGADGCPISCLSSTSCTGGQVWCTSGAGSGGWCQMPPCPSTTSACASGYYWCSSTNSCISNNTTCTPTGSETCPSGQTRCYSSGSPSGWCQVPPCPVSTPTASSCTGGQVWCTSSSGSGGWCQMPPCPSTTPTSCGSGYYWCSSSNSCLANNSPCSTTPATPTCGSGQYLCNNTCVPAGSSCNNYSYYPPGSTTPTPTTPSPSPTTPAPVQNCGQCKVWKNDRCEPVPVGTPDPTNCGTNGVCDKYGGCMTLRSGQTVVGTGAICGNGWCDEDKGENKVNCPKECYNEPPKPLPHLPHPPTPTLTLTPTRRGPSLLNVSPVISGAQKKRLV